MVKIILASASPRRRELLRQIGLDFEVRVSNVEEKTQAAEPGPMVEELSRKKAEAVMKELRPEELGEDVLVIGADTVVAAEDKILGKPSDSETAEAILREQSGKSHKVYTGVTLLYRKGDSFTESPEEGGGCSASPEETRRSGEKDAGICRKTFHEVTQVSFYPMSEEEIRSYVATGDCMDKAGAYGVQGIFARYVKEIKGDYNNVVGLPAGRLYQEAKEWIRV